MQEILKYLKSRGEQLDTEIATALSTFEVKPELPTQKWRRLALTRQEQRYVTMLILGGPDSSATAPLAMLGSTQVSPTALDPSVQGRY